MKAATILAAIEAMKSLEKVSAINSFQERVKVLENITYARIELEAELKSELLDVKVEQNDR